MAHFARLDSNNVVRQIIVVRNEDILDKDGNESEAVGLAFIKSIGLDGTWVQTSYNNSFRGKYACPGEMYDPELDKFVAPTIEE
jgi:hypothetical protein